MNFLDEEFIQMKSMYCIFYSSALLNLITDKIFPE